jgi:four helix bundle protein
MKDSIVLTKSYLFALRIVRLARVLRRRGEFDLARQLLRSGTSIGANVEEARAGSSRADFVNKMTIASKEAREAHFWLRLLRDSRTLEPSEVAQELVLAGELVRLLTSIVKTSTNSRPRTQNQELKTKN